MGQHIVAKQKVGLLAHGEHLPRCFDSKKTDQRRHSFPDGVWRDIGGGVDPQHRDRFLHEILQQVAIIAGQLDHQVIRPQFKSLGDHVHVLARVTQPRVGVGGEVSVFRINVVGRHIIAQLHEEALFADQSVQWIKRLHPIELILGNVTFA